MKKHITLFILCMFLSSIGIAQTQLQGKVTDQNTGEPILIGTVALYKGGALITGTDTDFDGNYFFSDVDPGTYDIEVSYVGYASQRITDVVAKAGKVTIVDVTLSEGELMDEVVIVGYKVPLVEFDNTTQGQTLTSEAIEQLPTKNIASIAASSAGVTVNQDGDISIRGSRSDATFYYIDGIRVSADNAANMVPQAQIEQLQVITGGIEAKYGDVTGGVISITSKGPSGKFTGGIEAETSEFLDDYGYNLLNANISGPILKNAEGNSVLGFRLFGQYRKQSDDDPSAVGVYRAPEELIRSLEAEPITFLEGVPFPSAQFLTADDVGAPISAQPNDEREDINGGVKLDAKLSEAMDISVSGSYYDQSNRFDISRRRTMFNWVNNPFELRDGYRGSFRFRHKLGNQSVDEDDKTSTIRNASYTLQFGYEKANVSREDVRHEDQLFNYGYYGRQDVSYDQRRSSQVTDPLWSRPVGTVFGVPFAYQGVTPVPGEFTADPTINPVLATDQYNSLNGVRDPVQSEIFTIFDNVGEVYNLNRRLEEDRYTINVNSGFDILPGGSEKGKHSLQFGFMYEQRVLRRWEMTPRSLWTLMRNLSNRHIENGVDTTQILGRFLDPVTGDSLEFYAPNNEAELFADNKFFRSVRDLLGVAEDEFVNTDALDPSQLSLDMFSPGELNNQNDLNLDYYGTDYLGNNIPTSTTFDDFFSGVDANGRRTFEVAPFNPNYVAGYIQDKFTFKDIIFRVGVRVDYYDANTKVLIDPFSFSDIESASDFYARNTDLTQPNSVGDDYKVYVSNDGSNDVKGYRLENEWFQPDGTRTDGLNLFGGDVIFPSYKETDELRRNPQYYVDQDERFDSSLSFEDYDPQLNVMPRLAFSFPISKDAGFFAHYDVLVQRPQANAVISTALDYYYFEDGQRFSSEFAPAGNPNLRPEKTIDYEVGFQQKISSSSAIKVSAYYKELRDMIQRRTFNFVPTVGSYETYDNLDFGTVKGFSFAYDLRRTKNFQLNATYTLQFADGTGSSLDSGRGINSRRNIREALPLSYDERHRITAIADYRFASGGNYDGPRIGGLDIFAETGVNLLMTAVSGRPFSTFGDISNPVDFTIVQSINETRLPWIFNADLQVDKNFSLSVSEASQRNLNFNVYLRFQNLFDLDNVVNVYRYEESLSPDDTGWLTSTRGQASRQNALDAGFTQESYDSVFAWRTLGPNNYARPRQIFLGLIMNF